MAQEVRCCLNQAQPRLARMAMAAVGHRGGGIGKTQTLAHRVAALIGRGVDPRRILLLTFTAGPRRDDRRAARLAGQQRNQEATLPWAGTFHAVANRLLRQHAQVVGLNPVSPCSIARIGGSPMQRLHDEPLKGKLQGRDPCA